MPYETLLLEVQDSIATLTLNRPKVLNALNDQLFRELDAALDALAADDAVRVVILTGSGEKAFAAGADIQELASVSAEEGRQLAARGQRVMGKMERLGKPVIACINGFALGGGCELAMACTFRIAGETARLGQPEVKLGLIPGYGGSQRLPRLIGQGAALKLLLSGEMISAAEALRLGLVEEVVPAAELMPRARQLAALIAGMAPVALRHCLAAVHDGAELPLDRALALEASLFGLCCATADKAEGTAAFLEKRAPRWSGH
ncbi:MULTISPECIES: enoyl-CoA hydratase-related protein [Acidobacterium]|uniref:3-hydroxybutyryl-CoA dehydratase n=1 Tax=Acidobacterium capsulatum (strain ATCC 51196 / DSM 11244 / BCRC 80197 / JCM 7670 / NBRC 15755 / NCIMB 13165 / 161) TaxID=240015 RepID=C1FAD2_ACIC5|nr:MULTISPECIES: enoyl-CoA hydratase-related protein [Acidobacterium]ACO34505.1 3-hydroxybutyryl-CoA dehydratase [Acidobacterium capsulatum ATCC 51196]HCT62366.1 enoyl-CoA hydratase [Acidobacterium sp.]